MEIIKKAHLKLTDKEFYTLREANEILNSICYNCVCTLDSCPLYETCPNNDCALTIGEMLGGIINEATTE